MNPETLKWLSSLGVGGVLAAGTFYIYRKDSLAAQQRIAELAATTTALAHKLIDAIGDLRATCARLDAAMGYRPGGGSQPPQPPSGGPGL